MNRLMTKPTKWLCAQRRLRSAQHPSSLIRVFAVRMKKASVLSYPLSAQRRLWSDWADAQADLSLRWTHSHFVGFDMRRLKYTFWLIKWVKCKCYFSSYLVERKKHMTGYFFTLISFRNMWPRASRFFTFLETFESSMCWVSLLIQKQN